LLDNEERDAATLSAYGVDFYKNDGCFTATPFSEGGFRADPSAFGHYGKMMKGLQASGRPIVHNVKGVPGGGIVADRAREVSNMRRCGDDIGGGFMSAHGSFKGCAGSQQFAGPGCREPFCIPYHQVHLVCLLSLVSTPLPSYRRRTCTPVWTNPFPCGLSIRSGV